MSPALAARTRFSQNRIFLTGAARGTEIDRPLHTRLHRRNKVTDIETAFDLWLKIPDFILRLRILQPIQIPAIRNRRHQTGKLQRSLGDLFAKTSQHPHAASLRRLRRKIHGMFAIVILSRLFAITEQLGVVALEVVTQLHA